MNILIIGAQGGGLSCAMRAKRNLPEANIIVFEKEDFVSFGACGLPYYIGNYFNDTSFLTAKNKESLEKSGLTVHLNTEIISIDKDTQTIKSLHLKTQKQSTHSYDKLIIATGASAKTLTSINKNTNNENNIFKLKTLSDAQLIKNKLPHVKNIVVVGAGFIGLEIIDALENMQSGYYNIYLIDNKKHVLDGLLSKDFHNEFEKHLANKPNIHLMMNSSIGNELIQENSQITLSVQKDNTQTTLHTDIIINCIGVTPNTQFTENLGLNKISNGAIKTDLVGKTNIENIYALGDCATIPHSLIQKHTYQPFATIANKMGRVVADEISGISPDKFESLGSYSCKLFNIEISSTGLTQEQASFYDIPYKTVFIKDYNHTNYYPNQKPVYIKLIINPENNVIIGAQTMGEDGAALRAHALSVAVYKKLTTEELSMIDFAYSPAINRTWEALNIAGNVAKKAK